MLRKASSSSTVTATETLAAPQFGGLAVTKEGVIPSLPHRTKVSQFYRRQGMALRIGYRLRWQPVVEFSERAPHAPRNPRPGVFAKIPGPSGQRYAAVIAEYQRDPEITLTVHWLREKGGPSIFFLHQPGVAVEPRPSLCRPPRPIPP